MRHDYSSTAMIMQAVWVTAEAAREAGMVMGMAIGTRGE